MTDKISTDQKNQVLFFQLIMSFQAAAYHQMGKIKNPLTDKIERDMQQAQLSIDIIDMIKIKTEGNRTPEETSFIDEISRELKLNYVDELKKDKKSDAEKEQPTETDKKTDAGDKKESKKVD